MSFQSLTPEQMRAEIQALRLQAEACVPSAGLLQSQRHHELLKRAWRLESELTRRELESMRRGKLEAKRLRHCWVRSTPYKRKKQPELSLPPVTYRGVEERINREADASLARALDIA